MMFIMIVTLYTSRVILRVLGVVDYGIYNVIGGVSSSFIFFSTALSNATQRFLNIKLGENNITGAREVFNNCFLIYLGIGLIICIVGIPLGYWFVTHKLQIPPERMDAAIWVFYVTIIMFTVTMMMNVFDSVLIARENMKVYAYIGILEAVLKLLIVYAVSFTDYDRLKLYALLLCITHITAKSLPAVVSLQKYEECTFNLTPKKSLIKEMFGFIGWNGFGCAVWMINEQGINILLNMFFGPVVNAARAISAQVTAAVNNFSSNFFVATRPQIIKSYAAKDYDYFTKLLYASSKFSFFLTWALCLPIMAKAGYILDIWLKTPPAYAAEFVVWSLLYCSINVLTNPSWSAIQAIGKLGKYISIGSTVFLMIFPLSFLLLWVGHNPVVVFKVMCIIRFIYVLVAVQIINQYIEYPLISYLKQVIFPISIVALPSALLNFSISNAFDNTFIMLLIFSIISFSITIFTSFIIGLNRREKNLVISKIHSIVCKTLKIQ